MTDWNEVARILEESNRKLREVAAGSTPPPALRPREVIECEDAVGPLAHRPLEPPASDVGSMLDARLAETEPEGEYMGYPIVLLPRDIMRAIEDDDVEAMREDLANHYGQGHNGEDEE